MRIIIQLISYLGIVVLVLPSVLFLGGGRMQLDLVKTIMLIATIIWFAASIIQVWNLDKKFLGKPDK